VSPAQEPVLVEAVMTDGTCAPAILSGQPPNWSNNALVLALQGVPVDHCPSARWQAIALTPAEMDAMNRRGHRMAAFN